MDAKVDGWVVTPRRGKAVEINALWYNALRLMERWAPEHGDDAERRTATRADQAQRSFNERFWYARGRLSLRRRRRRRRRQRSDVPAEPGVRDLAAASGAAPRALGGGAAGRARAAADAGRPALAGARRSRLQGAATSATCARATPRITRARCGAGWSARSSTRGSRSTRTTSTARARALDGFRAAPRRGVHRIDQRSLRRRAPVHAARLHRAGVERRRAVARVGEARYGSALERRQEPSRFRWHRACDVKASR